jgi:hypothetical protein
MPLHVRGAQVSSLALTAERALSTSHDWDKNNFSENTEYIESNHPSKRNEKKKCSPGCAWQTESACRNTVFLLRDVHIISTHFSVSLYELNLHLDGKTVLSSRSGLYIYTARV